jgi:hypothetical protein
MGREKGTTKTGGRKPGTSNKITSSIRDRIYKLVSDNMDIIEADINGLDAEKRVDAYIKLLPYVSPKLLPVAEEQQKKQNNSALNNTLDKLAQLAD